MEQCVLFYNWVGGKLVADTHMHGISWADVQWALDNRPGIVVNVTKVQQELWSCHRGETFPAMDDPCHNIMCGDSWYYGRPCYHGTPVTNSVVNS